ncbi:MAG: iron-containing alcohol dehydrogenase, partial [Methanobacteriota archaeon]
MDGSSFTKSKLMEFPRHVLVGHDVLGDAGRFCRDLALEGPATLVVGRKTRKIAGDAVASSLEADGVKVQSIEVRGATRASVAAVDRQVRETHSRFLLGVGGGSVIDVAKLAAAEASLSFVSVPTTASHDGITSPRASIEEERGKASLQAHAPVGILADTHVIVKAPYRTLAAGCADVISNSTAVLDWKLAHRLKGEEYSSFAAVLAETAAEMMIENAGAVKPNLEDSCWIVVKSLIVSGTSMSVAGSSRPASGAEHMVSH